MVVRSAPSPESRATPTNPPCARRCHAPNRCLRSTRSATAGNRCPAAGSAAPSSRRKSWRTALRRNRRSHAHAAADSDVDKKDGSQPSAGPCWGPTSLAADPVCVCPSTWAKCSTRRWPCRSLSTGWYQSDDRRSSGTIVRIERRCEFNVTIITAVSTGRATAVV